MHKKLYQNKNKNGKYSLSQMMDKFASSYSLKRPEENHKFVIKRCIRVLKDNLKSLVKKKQKILKKKELT